MFLATLPSLQCCSALYPPALFSRQRGEGGIPCRLNLQFYRGTVDSSVTRFVYDLVAICIFVERRTGMVEKIRRHYQPFPSRNGINFAPFITSMSPISNRIQGTYLLGLDLLPAAANTVSLT